MGEKIEHNHQRMNPHHLSKLISHFNLSKQKQEPKRVYGGLLHIMWRLDTDNGSYAVKQLSNDIDLTNSNVIKNYELTEHIAQCFAKLGIPAICAIKKSEQYLFILDGTGFLIYPWSNGDVARQGEININHSLEIAKILAKIHHINLHFEEVPEDEFDIYDNKYITELINNLFSHHISFAKNLKKHLPTLLEINEKYLASITTLKNHMVISHGDLDQKNVLWNNMRPTLIDWEMARKINPTYEILNAALDWSGVNTNLDTDLFCEMLKTYKQEGGLIDNNNINTALNGILGNWNNWMIYNIKRFLESKNDEIIKISINEINQVLPAILQVKNLMPELINLAESISLTKYQQS